MNRWIKALLPLIALCALTGCGGGSAYNIDSGANVDGHGNKIIRRTLQNDSDYHLSVELKLNNNEYIDTIDLAPREEMTVVIDNLYEDDAIHFYGDFENGGVANGTFDEDGRTVFSYLERSASQRAADGNTTVKMGQVKAIDGKAAVNSGGAVKRYLRPKKQ